MASVLAIGGAAVVGGLMPWRSEIWAWMETLPDRLGESQTGQLVKWGAPYAAMVLTSVYFLTGGLATFGGQAVGSTGAATPGAPNTPTISVAVDDTSTWRVPFSAFVGSGSDTQDSISVTVLRTGTSDTLIHLVSATQTVDTISGVTANDSLKADSVYEVFGRQKGTSGGWSAYDSAQVTNTVSAFPTAYSCSRSLLSTNPTGVLLCWDWQDITQQSDIEGYGWQAGSTGNDAATCLQPDSPGGAEYGAHFVDTLPVFGEGVRVYTALDGDAWCGASKPNSVQHSKSFTGVDFAWYRFAIRWNSTWDARKDAACGASAAHKFTFTSALRQLVFNGAARLEIHYSFEIKPDPGGSDSTLTNSPYTQFIFHSTQDDSRGFAPWNGTTAGDEQWYTFTIAEERLDATSWRRRIWFERISQADTLISPDIVLKDDSIDANTVTWSGGIPAKVGTVFYGLSSDPTGISNNIKLGINRNCYIGSGEADFWEIGPVEVLDGDVIADPYGKASDML